MKYSDINWEEEEVVSDKPVEQDEFARMMEQSEVERVDLRKGQQVEGRISSINLRSDTVLIEVDSQHTGVMDYAQLLDEQGKARYEVGDKISAYVLSRKGGEVVLSMSLTQSQQSSQDLRLAMDNELPVKGKVIGENPGGFDVQIMGKRAFCPVSQMDMRYVNNKAEYLGKDFNFIIEKIEEGGRNIVVSRAKLLRKEAELKLADIEAKLDEDIIFDAKVSEVRDYGAFLDLGGIEGFLHISELSYSRVTRLADFIARGDSIRVKVIKVEEKDGKKRIFLSARAVEDDPWLSLSDRYQTGASYAGKVTKLEDFGAFIELESGVEGLIHISEMSWEKRIHHPKELLSVGDQVSVRILSVDTEKKKLSLSLKHVEDDPWAHVDELISVGKKLHVKVEQLKGFGAIVAIADTKLTGLIPLSDLKRSFGDSYKKQASPPKELEVRVVDLDQEQRKILLSSVIDDERADDVNEIREYIKQQKAKTQVKASKRGSFGDLLAAKLEQDKNK